MNKELISEIAMEIVNETIFTNYKFYLILLGLVIISSTLSVFVGSYLRKRGESYATKQDFNNILDQVEKTTKATEEIKSNIFSEKIKEEERRRVTREKLEEIFDATYNFQLWLEQSRSTAIAGDKMFDVNSSPLAKIEALQRLYFPLCHEELNKVIDFSNEMLKWMLQLNGDAAMAKVKGEYKPTKTEKFAELHTALYLAISNLRTSLLNKYADNVGL